MKKKSVEFAYSTNGEDYVGGFDSRDDAMFECSALHSDNEVFFTAECVYPSPSSFVCVDSLLEQIGDYVFDNHGEYAEEWPILSKEEKSKLETYLKKFFDKHCPVNFFGVKDVEEHYIEDFDALDLED